MKTVACTLCDRIITGGRGIEICTVCGCVYTFFCVCVLSVGRRLVMGQFPLQWTKLSIWRVSAVYGSVTATLVLCCLLIKKTVGHSGDTFLSSSSSLVLWQEPEPSQATGMALAHCYTAHYFHLLQQYYGTVNPSKHKTYYYYHHYHHYLSFLMPCCFFVIYTKKSVWLISSFR